MGLLQEVRDSCAWVCEHAHDVRINAGRVEEYAKTLAGEAPVTELDPRYHFAGGIEETAGSVLILDAVNFGSGWFPVLDKTGASSGYYKVALSLKSWFEKEGVPAPHELAAASDGACAEIFGQQGNAAVAELMELYARALGDLGITVTDYGSYEEFVGLAGGNAERLMSQLLAMPLFRDTASYGGRTVAFYKRAQITVSDLHLAFGGAGLGFFSDVDDLTCFADNLVPHVLRVDGVLEYSSELSATIAAGQLLPAGSSQEVEIRAAGVHAIELLARALGGDGKPLPARAIDNMLWERGHEERYRRQPRHRARSVFY